MKQTERFVPGGYYHIYNHGNANEDIFKCPGNYDYFLRKHHEYMKDTWNLLAWCLLPTQFHLIVQINETANTEILDFNKLVANRFGNFANGYAKAINKVYLRRGSLFMRAFRRKQVTDKNYLRELIRDLHFTPVRDQLVIAPEKWIYSSFRGALLHPTQFPEVMEIFGGVESFLKMHGRKNDSESWRAAA